MSSEQLVVDDAPTLRRVGLRGALAHTASRLREGLGNSIVRAYLVTFVISSLVVSTWFRAGTFISTGDMGPFIRQGWSEEMSWSWNHQITGAGSAAHTVGRALEFFLIDIADFVGGDEYLAQWMFYTLIYGFVAVGVAYAAGAIVKHPVAIVAAGTFSVLNGFFLTRLPNPLNIISVGTVALFIGLALRIAKGRRISPVVGGIAFLPTSFLAFNPPMMVVAAMWAVAGTTVLSLLIVGWGGLWRLIKYFVRTAPWVILLNAWWLVPFAQAYTGGGGAEANATFTDPTNWSWAQINNNVPNILTLVANWAWFRPQYLPFADSLDQPYWIWMRYLIPALVVLSPLLALRSRRRPALALLGVSGVIVFLAKGLLMPFGDVNLWIYKNIPMFWLFREPMSKLGQALVVLFGILFAIALEGALRRAAKVWAAVDDEGLTLGQRILRFLPRPAALAAVGVVGAFLLIIAYPRPLYTGDVIPDVRPMQPSAHVRVPDFWWDMARTIDEDPRPGKVLVLPLDDYYQMPTTWGFFGVDSIANLLSKHPVVQPKPDGYFGDVPGFAADVDAIELALVSGDLSPVPSLLDATGISEVIIRHDLLQDMPGRTFADDQVLSASMRRVSGVTQVVDGPLELWQVGEGESPSVRRYNQMISAPADPEAGAAILGSMGTGTAIKPAQKSTPSQPTRVDSSPKISDDSTVWPVPAVDTDEDARTTVRLKQGTYQVDQRARAGAVLRPSYDGKDVVLTDTSEIRLDGKVVSRRPVQRVPVPGDPVAVRIGSRFVSLGDQAPDKTDTVVVAADTPFVAFQPSEQPARSTPMSDVYDCNNYEPRPTRELELKKVQLKNGVTQLSALDHAACTRIDVEDVEAGQTYRVQLEYRQVKGKRPQICVWQVGTDACEIAPRAQLGGKWTPYEKIVTIDEIAEGLQLILHADVGERLLGRTVTEYRNVRIEKLDSIHESTLWPKEIPTTTVEVKGGDHELSVSGGLSGSILAPFEPLQDCFRYDDQTLDEAGLSAEIDGDPNNPTFTLTARAHMACLGATIPDMGNSSLYELSLEAKGVNLRDPKFCLYMRGPDTCTKLPGPVMWDGWTRYEALLGPESAAVETRLYLYGMRDLEEKEVSTVKYRDVKLRPLATPSSVVLVRQPDEDTDTLQQARLQDVDYKRLNPAQYQVSDIQEGEILALTETFAPGWTLSGAEHLSLNGWMNAWIPSASAASGTMTYAPALLSRKALLVLPVGIVLALLLILWQWWRRRPYEDVADASAPDDPLDGPPGRDAPPSPDELRRR